MLILIFFNKFKIGGKHGSGVFSNMVTNKTARANFVSSSVKFLKQYGFDGLGI